jgi:hypothetical protein
LYLFEGRAGTQYADRRAGLVVRVEFHSTRDLVLDAGGEPAAHHEIWAQAHQLPVEVILLCLEHLDIRRSSQKAAARAWL